MKRTRNLLLSSRLKKAKEFSQIWRLSPSEEIAEKQLFLLRKRWREACKSLPYYRQLVEEGQVPKDFSSLREFSSTVPILTREILVKKRHLFQREKKPDDQLMTAGSTGDPLQFGIWRDELENHTGIPQWVGRFHNGMDIDDRVFILWGHSHLLGTGVKGRFRSLVRNTKDSLMGYKRVDAYKIDPTISEEYFSKMLRFNPSVVIGYSCTLDLWARQCLAQKLKSKDLKIKLCIACSENFPHPDSRQVLEEFLGCQVVMEYGGVDFGVCAYELAASHRYHTFWWSHFLEVEHNQENGSFLVTNLTDRYLPMFRYSNGDECSGAKRADSGHIQSFSAIKGRINDTLQMPNGISIHSVGLFHCIHQEPVWSIQLVKRGMSYRIKLAAADFPPSCEHRIRKRLRDLHPDLEFCPIEVEKDVTTNRAGKRRWIVFE